MSESFSQDREEEPAPLIVSEARGAALRAASRDWPSWELTPRQLCDLELLLSDASTPVRGFMTRPDYESVCASMRLCNGDLWPVPLTLDVAEEVARSLGPGAMLALRDPEGVMLAALRVEDVFRPDRWAEAEALYATAPAGHTSVAALVDESHPFCVGGALEGLQLPVHYDFRLLRLTPTDLRAEFGRLGWRRVMVVQVRRLMHRAQMEFALHTARAADAGLLIQAMSGTGVPGELDHYVRIRCLQAILRCYPPDAARLALLPLNPRGCGPRDALWRAIIARNHGCTHLVVGGEEGDGQGPSAGACRGVSRAADLEILLEHEREVGVRAVPFEDMVYAEDRRAYLPASEAPVGSRVLSMSAAELQQRLSEGADVPAWFTPPGVVRELRRAWPPRHRQGFTVFFTGLSGSGKSTVANVVRAQLLETGDRPVTLLDGDIVRKHLSSELGFSKEHRDINIRRIGFVAAEITKSGGVAICAPIAPYDSVRRQVREMVRQSGGFVLVHVATPLAVCERRDCKGLYAKARAGILKAFTGISDPYEPPTDAEVVIDTSILSPEQAANQILQHLKQQGFIATAEPEA